MESIKLINIRSFTDSGAIRIAPLTLLLGENSSGKSTVVRCFPLLRQTAEVLAREPILWFGRLVDFGTVDEATSKLATTKSTGFDFQFQIERAAINRRRRVYRPTTDGDKIPAKVALRYEFKEGKKKAYHFSLEVLSHQFSLEIQDSVVTKLLINGSDYSSHLAGAMIVPSWTSCFPNIIYRENSTGLVDSDIFGRNLRAYVRQHTHGKSGTDRVEALTRGLINSPLDDLLAAVKNASASDSMWQRTTAAWTGVTRDFHRVRDLIIGSRISELVDIAGQIFRQTFGRSRYIAPIRASAERYYRQQGLALGEIDAQGQNVAMFLHNLSTGERARFSEWMSSAFGFYVDTETSQGHVSMVVRDTKVSGAEGAQLSFNLADTGFGFSQMIPVLMQIWITSGGRGQSGAPAAIKTPLIISIEQPELHLHPRLQARMADVLLKAITGARQVGVDLRVVVETHSEQIVNRVGKRIAEGAFPRADASVALFEKRSFGEPTTVIQTDYDEEGMLESWPYGFFESEDK